jgi:hypothetical protein
LLPPPPSYYRDKDKKTAARPADRPTTDKNKKYEMASTVSRRQDTRQTPFDPYSTTARIAANPSATATKDHPPWTTAAAALPAELVCAILERIPVLWLPVAARVCTTWYDCAAHVGGSHDALVISMDLVDEAIVSGASTVALWCLSDLGCPWTGRRALLAAVSDCGLAEWMGGSDSCSPVTAVVALAHRCGAPADHMDCAESADDLLDAGVSSTIAPTEPTLSSRLWRLERTGHHWDEATIACATVSASAEDFASMVATRPVGLGLAWVVASAIGRVDILDALAACSMHAMPAGACTHVAHEFTRAWMARLDGRLFWSRVDVTRVRTSGWRSWADPPEDALAVWIAHVGVAEFRADPAGHLAAALLGVEYEPNTSSRLPMRERIMHMTLCGQPSYERGPYLSQSARIARETMLKVDAILKTSHGARPLIPTATAPQVR